MSCIETYWKLVSKCNWLQKWSFVTHLLSQKFHHNVQQINEKILQQCKILCVNITNDIIMHTVNIIFSRVMLNDHVSTKFNNVRKVVKVCPFWKMFAMHVLFLFFSFCKSRFYIWLMYNFCRVMIRTYLPCKTWHLSRTIAVSIIFCHAWLCIAVVLIFLIKLLQEQNINSF